MKKELTHARLLELLQYEPTTGIFTWLRSRGGKAIKGSRAGALMKHGYRQIGVDGTFYLEHRLAWFYMHTAWPVAFIDHKFGKRDDNRISEIREASCRLNSENLREANRLSQTGLLGASPSRNGRFVARIAVCGKVKHLGYFKTAEAAHKVYVEAKRNLHEGCML